MVNYLVLYIISRRFQMKEIGLEDVVRVFSDIAKEAGKIILSYRGKVIDLGKKYVTSNEEKDANKFTLSLADLQTQKFILSELFKFYPFFGICSEEEDPEIIELEEKFSHRQLLLPNQYTVVIDPIDGTSNFLGKGDTDNFDNFAVQINLVYGFEMVAGVVYFPATDRIITTWKNGPALINNVAQKIKAKNFSPLDACRISSNYDLQLMTQAKMSYKGLKTLFPNSPSYGASCYNLYALLVQKLDWYMVSSIEIIDFGSTSLAFKNAGGFVGDHSGQPVDASRFIKKIGDHYHFCGMTILVPTQTYLKEFLRYVYANQQ